MQALAQIDIGALIPQRAKLSAIQRRLIEPAERDQRAVFQHTTLCQTCLPHSDPGAQRVWDARNGDVLLRVKAGEAADPHNGEWREYGLPWGARARLVLIWLASQAKLRSSPVIELERRNITHYVRCLGLQTDGRTIRSVTEQLMRVCTADYHLAVRISQQKMRDYAPQRIVSVFEPSASADGSLVLPEAITLADWYYVALKNEAVPLVAEHIARLKHSALALDVYTWLAQRLHRIPCERPQPILWSALYRQFGHGYDMNNPAAIRDWRKKFLIALKGVSTVYKDARVDVAPPSRPTRQLVDGREVWREARATGITLHRSKPPVPPRHL